MNKQCVIDFKIGCDVKMNVKNRKIIGVSIIIMLFAGSFLYLSPNAVAAPSVSITVDNAPTKVGDTFIASVNVAGIVGLWGWNTLISWNPEVLSLTRSAKGPFLTSDGASDLRPQPVIRNGEGTVYIAHVLLEANSVSGDGILDRLTFEVIGPGNTDLTFSSLIFLDEYNPHGEIPYTISSVPAITITGSTNPPEEPSNPPEEPIVTPVLTVSTDKSVYSLGDLVSVSATVTYAGGAVSNRLVAFTVFQHDGTQLGTYVSTTDSLGKAAFTFRIPTPGDSSAGIFGDWSILTAVSISETDLMCAVTFTVVGQTMPTDLSITSITVTNSVQKPGKVSVSLTLDGAIPEGLVLTTSVFDSAKVPLGMSMTSLTAQTQGTTTITTEINIPSWAFIGQANLYINLLTATPTLGGTPYCSQTTRTFEIT